MRSVNRRRFLYAVAGVAGAAGLVCVSRWQKSDVERAAAAADWQRVQRTAWALGSSVSLTVLHADADLARKAIDAAFDELERVESLMSIYRPESQLSQLNRHKQLDNPHPYLVEVLRAARDMSRRTAGAFDITVQPLWELYATAQKSQCLPTAAEIRAAQRRVDWRQVETTAAHVRLLGSGTEVTLNGIAQGFAADRVGVTLRSHGVQHALIDTGEIGTLGSKPAGVGWTVGIQDPRDEDAWLSLAALADRCLATSGDYASHFTPDFRQHHLFDPRTGCSPVELSSVSVVAESALAADALSTAVFVLGPDAGLQLVRKTPGADALLVNKDGQALATPSFPFGVEG